MRNEQESELTINLFTYGTLTFQEVARSLAGDVGTGQCAIVDGFVRYEATLRESGNFPYVIANPGDSVKGVLYRNITPRQLEIFDWFEGAGSWYHRIQLDRIRVTESQSADDLESDPEETVFREIELDVEAYVIGEKLENAIQLFIRSQSGIVQRRSWDPKRFYRNHLAKYFQETVIATINDPDFKRKFGGPDDPQFIQELSKKFE